jgi:prepilin-type N-terminal cleavage/methylation domain-containing protein
LERWECRKMPWQTTKPEGTHKAQGFTLIELLIVVAIIAILAAIVVPNFLEAQTRAKVSRARADIRSVATALESYVVDNNHYPTMYNYAAHFANPVTQLADLLYWYVPDALSTPIAYLSSADLRCPFGGDKPQSANFPGELWRRYSYENVNELMDYHGPNWQILSDSSRTPLPKYAVERDPLHKIGRWRVLCIGPDIAWNPMIQYDPTNGTTSTGNIMRTQVDSQGLGSEQN